MNPLTEPLSRSPELFPHSLDVRTDSLSLIHLSEADYAKASFLDGRILGPGLTIRPAAFREVRDAIEEAGLPETTDFIFHIGHVGSTLLSRLLGRHPALLGLREPDILRTLARIRADAEVLPRRWSAEEFEAHLATALKLWSRTFRPEQRALIKATSFASELAAEILRRPSQPKAIFMFVSPESYLATILGAEHSPREAQMLADFRAKRLQHRIGGALNPVTSMGALVAMSWASEMCALAAAQDSSGRIRWLDFDRFLADPATALADCFRHLGVETGTEQIAQIVSGPDMHTYSKAQEHGYDAALRGDVLNQARQMFGDEIRRGLDWLTEMAAKYPVVAAAAKRAQPS
jgi:hypothetical protein